MSYEGPGLYRHYKGGTYIALGIAEDEATGTKLEVVYFSCSVEHEARRAGRGVNFIRRPLNPEDGPDAWNEPARLEPDTTHPEPEPTVERFERVEGFEKATTR